MHIGYKQKLLSSNLADTRRDDSHLKLDALRNNRMGMKGRGFNRGRGGKMIINKDGSTTMIPFQRDGQQVAGGVMATTSKVRQTTFLEFRQNIGICIKVKYTYRNIF